MRIERFDVDLMNRQPGQSSHEPFGREREVPHMVRNAPVHRPAHGPSAQDDSSISLQAAPGRLNVIV